MTDTKLSQRTQTLLEVHAITQSGKKRGFWGRALAFNQHPTCASLASLFEESPFPFANWGSNCFDNDLVVLQSSSILESITGSDNLEASRRL